MFGETVVRDMLELFSQQPNRYRYKDLGDVGLDCVLLMSCRNDWTNHEYSRIRRIYWDGKSGRHL
jgi:hypothetical protein